RNPTMPSSRRWLALAFGASLATTLAGDRLAHADLPAGAGTLKTELRIPDPNHPPPDVTQYIPPNTTQQLFGFNRAHCLCSQPLPQHWQSNFAIRTSITGAARPSPLMNHSVQLWIGQGCNDLTTRNMSCVQLVGNTIADYDTLFVTSDHVFPIQPVVDANGPA